MTSDLVKPLKPRRWRRPLTAAILLIVVGIAGAFADAYWKSKQEDAAIERLSGVASFSEWHAPLLSLPRFIPGRIQSLLPHRREILSVEFRPGTLNPGAYLRDIPSLRLSSINTNQLDLTPDDLEQFAHHPSLRSMTIRECQLAEGSLNRLQNLPLLTYLSLERSTMSSHDEIDFPTLPHLISINLSRSNVSERTLRRISDHPNLRRIDLNSSTVSDETLKHLRRLPQLEKIHLGKTWITGIGLLNLEAPVTKIYLYGTNADDAAMTVISGLRSLRSLDLQNTRITTMGVRKLRQLPNLQELDLDGCPLGDEVREVLSAMPNLKHWTAKQTRVSLPNTSGLGFAPDVE